VQSQSEAKEESLTLYPERLILQGRYKTVALSRSETLILSGLTRAPDHMLEPTQICRLLGLEAASYSKSALEVRFVRLRKKIIEAGYTLPAIKKVRKKGYQLSVPLQII
jgi:DNA-binding response OmpR family regulator